MGLLLEVLSRRIVVPSASLMTTIVPQSDATEFNQHAASLRLLAGILASMTTNLEDFQQLQTPIVVISLIGYYLSMMAGMFRGSIFIRIASYIPFISSMLSPTLYVLGEITIFDLIGSILLLVLVIYLLIKYGLRIYKVGILNYSSSNLWKKIFKALKS